MINKKIIYAKETNELTIQFLIQQEIHVGTVVSVECQNKIIYFKTSEVCTYNDNLLFVKATAKVYGYRNITGKIDIRFLMQDCFVKIVTDEEILKKLSQENRWL